MTLAKKGFMSGAQQSGLKPSIFPCLKVCYELVYFALVPGAFAALVLIWWHISALNRALNIGPILLHGSGGPKVKRVAHIVRAVHMTSIALSEVGLDGGGETRSGR